MRLRLKLVIMLCFLMSFLHACGNKGINSEIKSADSTQTAQDVIDDTENITEDKIDTTSNESPVPESETAAEEDISPKLTKGSELIVMTVQSGQEEYYSTIKIEGISPETGIRREIAVFPNNFRQFDDSVAPNPIISTFPDTCMECKNGNFRDIFSEDFTKAAAEKMDMIDVKHAGWIDINGVFTDVTENFHSRFPENYGHGLIHNPLGFENEYFYFDAVEYTSESSMKTVYYRVRIDDAIGDSLEPVQSDTYNTPYGEVNIQAAWDMDKYPDYQNSYFYQTDWLDETHVLGDITELTKGYFMDISPEIVIYDTAAGEIEQLIPTEYGICRNGVVSPDKQSVAFLMNPNNGRFSETGIYIKNLSSDEIMLVETDSMEQFADGFVNDEYREKGMLYPRVSLLEWR